MKAYFTTLAARPFRLSGFEIRFTPCSISGGRASGYYETEHPGEIAVLDDAVRGRRGIKEISLAEVEEIKKKTPIRHSLSSTGSKAPRVVRIPTLPELSVEAAPGVASTGRNPDGSQRPPEELPPSPSIGSLIRVERVNPPKPFATSDAKTKKASARGERAKVRVARAADAS